jgi:3-methyladenine DNA glycosylase/8-oxoguanine DNA glycosylase
MPQEALRLDSCQHVDLFPTAPFDFESTVHKPSHFPGSNSLFENGCYWFTLRFEDAIFGIKLTNAGTIEQPKLDLAVYSASPISEAQLSRIVSELEFRFDLNADLKAFYQDCEQDDLLKPALERWQGSRDSNINSLYEYLVIATVLQNTTVRRSVQMSENLFAAYGSKVAYDGKVLSAFWSPQTIHEATEDDLRALKVGYRAKTFKRQAAMFAAGELDEMALRELPDDLLKAKLLKLYGIGPASVWYLLFGVFKRYDAFEYISPWEQKIYSRLLFDQEWVDAKWILQEVERRWGKWKMLAAHYLFEDLFWQRKNQPIPWLEELIRL